MDQRIRFTRIRNCRISQITSAHERGVSRSSRYAGRDAVDAGCVGAISNRRAGQLRERIASRDTTGAACVRQNRVVLAPAAGAKSWGNVSGPTGRSHQRSPRRRWQESSSHRGDRDISRSNHCAGKAGRNQPGRRGDVPGLEPGGHLRHRLERRARRHIQRQPERRLPGGVHVPPDGRPRAVVHQPEA